MKTALFAALLICSTAYSQGLQVRQVPGQKFVISGTGLAKDTVVVASGAASGVAGAKADGTFEMWVITSTLGDVSLNSSSGSLGTVKLTNAAPVITSFTITKLGSGYVFSGTVNDEAPEGLTITFFGPMGINGNIATVNAAGTFSVLLSHNGVAAMVEAAVTDWYGMSAKRTANLP